MEANAGLFIDRTHPKQNGMCTVKIRIRFNRQKKDYPTGVALLPDDFDKIVNAKRRSESEAATFKKMDAYLIRAKDVLEEINVFSFQRFEDEYLSDRKLVNTVSGAFDKYIQQLRNEDRIGTAVSYETAKNSINEFVKNKNITFVDITPRFLKDYEKWMLANGKTKTTVGIYLRSLRTIYNTADIDRALYPFGEGRGKYSIPTGRNIKKALTLDEVSRIFNYAPASEMEAMAKDYWIFVYLCNGINMKDMLLLRRKDINGDILTYQRAKTINSKREAKAITVSLKPEAKEIIRKYGRITLSAEDYIFPHLDRKMSAVRQREVIQNVTHNVNKHLKKIAATAKIDKPITTYSARHSFATILKNSGVNPQFIGEALGHSNLKTTENYFAGFEQEAIHEMTNVLTSFKNAK